MRAVAVRPRRAVVTCVTTFLALAGPVAWGWLFPQLSSVDNSKDSDMF